VKSNNSKPLTEVTPRPLMPNLPNIISK